MSDEHVVCERCGSTYRGDGAESLDSDGGWVRRKDGVLTDGVRCVCGCPMRRPRPEFGANVVLGRLFSFPELLRFERVTAKTYYTDRGQAFRRDCEGMKQIGMREIDRYRIDTEEAARVEEWAKTIGRKGAP